VKTFHDTSGFSLNWSELNGVASGGATEETVQVPESYDNVPMPKLSLFDKTKAHWASLQRVFHHVIVRKQPVE
jgi:hypothetical protein